MEMLASGLMLLIILHRLSLAVVTVAYIIASLAYFFGRKKIEQNIRLGLLIKVGVIVTNL
jgi:hypothetical protein